MSRYTNLLGFVYIGGRRVRTSAHLAVRSRVQNPNDIENLLDGDRYWIDGIGFGEWFNQGYNIAIYEDGQWSFEETQVGSLAYVIDEDEYYYYDGTNLLPFGVSEDYELDLGTPDGDNYILTSDQGGNRKWVARDEFITYSLNKANSQYLSYFNKNFTNINSNYRFQYDGLIKNIHIYYQSGQNRKFFIYKNNILVYDNYIESLNHNVDIQFDKFDLLNIFIGYVESNPILFPIFNLRIIRI